MQRQEYQQKREEVLEVLQIQASASLVKAEKENVVLKMLFGQGRRRIWIKHYCGFKGKKEGYSQTTALGKRGLYHCQQHCKWQANDLSLREMIMSSQTFKMLMIIKNIARTEWRHIEPWNSIKKCSNLNKGDSMTDFYESWTAQD